MYYYSPSFILHIKGFIFYDFLFLFSIRFCDSTMLIYEVLASLFVLLYSIPLYENITMHLFIPLLVYFFPQKQYRHEHSPDTHL